MKKSSERLYTTRPHKDDPSLYTKDGILHLEDENIQRGPWVNEEESKIVETTIKDEYTKELPKEIDEIDNDAIPVLEVD